MKYNWKNYPQVEQFLLKIDYNTKTKMDKSYLYMKEEYINDLEDYIVQCIRTGYITSENIDVVINRMNRLEFINVLPENLRGIYGFTTKDYTQVLVNPDLDRNRRKLYLFHELSHMAIGIDEEIIKRNFESYKRIQEEDGVVLRNEVNYAKEGWTLIEEGIVQEIAESLLYASLEKERPQATLRRDPILGNATYKSNYDYYGLYQPIVTSLGRTLRGVGRSSSDSDQTILKDLCVKAFSKNFTLDIIKEYNNDVGLDNLYNILGNLGVIFQGKYNSIVGIRDTNLSTDVIKHSYSDVMNELARLEDYRGVIGQENHINFSENRTIRQDNSQMQNDYTMKQKVARFFSKHKLLIRIPFIKKYVEKNLNLLQSGNERVNQYSQRQIRNNFVNELSNNGYYRDYITTEQIARA